MTAVGAVDIGGTKIAVGIVDDAYGDGVMLITGMLRESVRDGEARCTQNRAQTHARIVAGHSRDPDPC